jgi:hypothetical protein
VQRHRGKVSRAILLSRAVLDGAVKYSESSLAFFPKEFLDLVQL